MSDRRRRWICQLLFIGLCVLPTAWVLLNIVYRPSPAYFAQQLQLQLGVPVTVLQLTTPNPDLALLQGVELRHPETGTWAVADRWAVLKGPTPVTPRWQISTLRIQQETLGEFIDQLHRSVVQQRMTAAASSQDGRMGGSLPTLHVQTLEVVSIPSGVSDDAASESRATSRQVALRLKDVVITWQWPAGSELPRLELAAKLVPPRGERDFLSTGIETPEIPLLCYLERRPLPAATGRRPAYLTHWEITALERPVPLAWLNLASWPTFLRQRAAGSFQGLLQGAVADRQWSLNCQQARLDGLDLSDLEFFLTGQRSQNQAAMRLRIHHLGWSGLSGGPAAWEACDVDVQAVDGQLAGELIQAAAQALTLDDIHPAERQVAYLPESPSKSVVRFAELNLGVRLRAGQLWLRPLEVTGKPLPILRGFNGQEQVQWGNQVERPWRFHSAAGGEVSPAEYLEAEVHGPRADQPGSEPRDPLEIAAIDLPWTSERFIVGVPVVDRFAFEPIATATEDFAPATSPQTIRAIIEHPQLALGPDQP